MRDGFSARIRDVLGRRASFICSNPDCRAMTLAPSTEDPERFIYVGKAAHIRAASEGGPRFDAEMTAETRKSIDNGIFLCATCADMIDRNDGSDFPPELLHAWKSTHEQWVRDNLNQSPHALISILDGEHHASGVGEVTGIDAEGPTLFKPGTRSSAEGIGRITATRIGPRRADST